MKTFTVVLALVCVAMPPAVAAQKVYRCKDPKGGPTIYSQTPCSSDGTGQEEIEVKTAKPPERTPEETARVEAMQHNRVMGNIVDREATCIRVSSDNVWRPANARIRQYEQQISQLEADTRRARNNLAGATWEAGLREQISSLQQMIATERQTASTQEIAARRECAEQRKAAEDKLATPAPTP